MAGKTEYKNKYAAENYERISLSVQKGQKAIIKAHADKKGESLNGFICRAINTTIASDNNENNEKGEQEI